MRHLSALGRVQVFPIAVPICLVFPPRVAIFKTLVRPMMNHSGSAFRNSGGTANGAYTFATRESFNSLIVDKCELHLSDFLSDITATFTGPRRKSMFPKAARPAAPCATYCYHARICLQRASRRDIIHPSDGNVRRNSRDVKPESLPCVASSSIAGFSDIVSSCE